VRSLAASWRVPLAGSLAGLAVVVLAAANPLSFFEIAELKALDAQFTLRGPREPQSPIVLVTIDEDSFDGLNLAWPWPRAVHAKFLDIVGRGGPVAIGMDILFTEPSSRGPADDAALGAAVDRVHDRIVLAAALTTVGDASFVKQALNPPIPEIRGRAAFGSADYDSDADAFVRPHARGASVFALSEKGATSAAASWLANRENAADLIGGVNLQGKDRYLKMTLADLSLTAQINDSLKAGRAVLSELGGVNDLHKSDVEQAGFAVLKAPDIPSILVETAFISNPEEELRLRSTAYQNKVAEAIFVGIKRYFVKNPPLARDRVALN